MLAYGRMKIAQFRFGLAIALLLAFTAIAEARVLFQDNFEDGLARWDVSSPQDIVIRSSGDPAHCKVLVLIPNGDVYALIRGSDRWKGIRMEGDVLFP